MASRWRASGCTTALCGSTTRRCPRAWATSSPSATCWQKYDAETVRFFLVRAHYRSALNYSDVHLDDARAALRRLYTALDLVAPAAPGDRLGDPFAARFKAAMDEDFGTPEAVAVLFDLAAKSTGPSPRRRPACSRRWAAAWGCCRTTPALTCRPAQEPGQMAMPTIDALIAQRAAAKAERDFATGRQHPQGTAAARASCSRTRRPAPPGKRAKMSRHCKPPPISRPAKMRPRPTGTTPAGTCPARTGS
jgi:hypothetical protein